MDVPAFDLEPDGLHYAADALDAVRPDDLQRERRRDRVARVRAR